MTTCAGAPGVGGQPQHWLALNCAWLHSNNDARVHGLCVCMCACSVRVSGHAVLLLATIDNSYGMVSRVLLHIRLV
jgi:hypothetical protein